VQRLARPLAFAAAALAATLVVAVPLPRADAARAAITVSPPATPPKLPTAIEALSGYVPQIACDPSPKPGAAALGRLLTHTYPGTSYGIYRDCGGGAMSTSEHYEGRALDWMDSIRDARQAAQAKAVLAWLLNSDAAHHPAANARRLGVMYLIWNNRIWSASDAGSGWVPYLNCAKHPETGWDTTCHRNHIHISLSWAGAMGRTSFWTDKVASTDYGPCRPADLNWAPPYRGANPRPCPRYARVKPPAGASAALVGLTMYSGVELRPGSSGPAVNAVQKALGVVNGPFGPKTSAAVAAFRKKQHLTAVPLVDAAAWRALLRAFAPKPKH